MMLLATSVIPLNASFVNYTDANGQVHVESYETFNEISWRFHYARVFIIELNLSELWNRRKHEHKQGAVK